jgi:hypothetical protein
MALGYRSAVSIIAAALPWCAGSSCILLLLATATSTFWMVRCTSVNHSVTLRCGAVEHLWRPPAVRDYIAPLCEFQSLKSEWKRDRCDHFRWGCGRRDYEGVWWTIVPLWIPLCVALASTSWLWLRKRHHKEGCCRNCGYDLTGNLSGRCPECGTLVTQRSRASVAIGQK